MNMKIKMWCDIWKCGMTYKYANKNVMWNMNMNMKYDMKYEYEYEYEFEIRYEIRICGNMNVEIWIWKYDQDEM